MYIEERHRALGRDATFSWSRALTHPPRCNRTRHRGRHLVSDFVGAAILDRKSWGPPSWTGSRGGRHFGSDVVTSLTLKCHTYYWPHPRHVILYARSSYIYDNMFIICLFSDILSDFKTCFGLLIPKNCGNVCHNVTFLDVTSTCFRLWFHACNLLHVTSPQKQVTDVSLVI